MSKVQYKKFRATIEYRVEVNEDFQPTKKDEKLNFLQLIGTDPEIVKPKVTVEEV